MADDQEKKDESKDSMSPEEKLFKAISRKDLDFTDDDSASQDLLETDFFSKIENGWKKVKSVFKGEKPLLTRIPSPRAGWSGDLKFGKTSVLPELPIKSVNKTLMALVGLLLCYLIVDFTFIRLQPTLPQAGSGAPVLSFSLPGSLEESSSLTRYVEQVNQRNIFLPQAPPAPPPSPAGEATSDAPLLPVETPPPTNYVLVGISWDNQEYVAMIESDPAKGASFVRKGEELAEGVKVVDITESSVKLSQGEKTWELS